MRLNIQEVYRAMLEEMERKIVDAERQLHELIGKQAGVRALYDALVQQAIADSKSSGTAPEGSSKSKADQPES